MNFSMRYSKWNFKYFKAQLIYCKWSSFVNGLEKYELNSMLFFEADAFVKVFGFGICYFPSPKPYSQYIKNPPILVSKMIFSLISSIQWLLKPLLINKIWTKNMFYLQSLQAALHYYRETQQVKMQRVWI